MNMGSFDSFHFDKWNERYKKSCFLGTCKNSKQKKLWNVILNSILTIFKKEKGQKITNYYYNILTIGINIIEFYIDTISDLGFTIILYLYPLYNFLKGDYWCFLFWIFFCELSTHLAITIPISSSESIKPYFLKIKDNRNFSSRKDWKKLVFEV